MKLTISIALISLILTTGSLIIIYQLEQKLIVAQVRQEHLMRRVQKLEYLRGLSSSYIGREYDEN